MVPGGWFGGREGVAVPRPAFGIGAGRRSGEGGDVSVGGEDVGGGWAIRRGCG